MEFPLMAYIRLWFAGEDHYISPCPCCKGAGELTERCYSFMGNYSHTIKCWRCDGRGYHIRQIGSSL